MSFVYFPLSKGHLADNLLKENQNNDCLANLKNIKIRTELVQNVPGLKIYPSIAQTSEPGSLREGSKQISRKVDFNIVRISNIPLGLKTSGEIICFFISIIAFLHSLSFNTVLVLNA